MSQFWQASSVKRTKKSEKISESKYFRHWVIVHSSEKRWQCYGAPTLSRRVYRGWYQIEWWIFRIQMGITGKYKILHASHPKYSWNHKNTDGTTNPSNWVNRNLIHIWSSFRTSKKYAESKVRYTRSLVPTWIFALRYEPNSLSQFYRSSISLILLIYSLMLYLFSVS